ncbi:nucleoside hydrolase [Dinoroseobacter sp. S375]|uniref:nucleoside hydrolase n=1 Tax=Dinoroseobacter sp. S375 TaxID=3415136 RepID=UPI003C7D092B
MSAIWVDTDMGFDDLWALLLLRTHRIAVAGVSLVAGNAPLPQVEANASGAQEAYGLEMPVFSGADRPLKRTPETAARILGPLGMRSRGQTLPKPARPPIFPPAGPALEQWLRTPRRTPERVILALGPLTNIAHLLKSSPKAAARITRLVWMGGSNGPGNHSPRAEYNSLADPEALDTVLNAQLPLDVVDLTQCRQHCFGPEDVPDTDPLSRDLLLGYLDIALERGRKAMAIYDPIAAAALIWPERFRFAPRAMNVSLCSDESYGETSFAETPMSRTRLVSGGHGPLVRDCLAAFEGGPAHAH